MVDHASQLGYISTIRASIKSLICPNESASDSPKVLLVDLEMRRALSCVLSHSEFNAKGVFYIDSLSQHLETDQTEEFNFLRCIIIASPSSASVIQIAKMLQHAKYYAFDIIMTSHVEAKQMERIVRADTLKKVQSFKIVPLDLSMLGPRLFTLGIDYSITRMLSVDRHRRRNEESVLYQQSLRGLLSAFSMFYATNAKSKERDIGIIYPRKSKFCQQLASDFRAEYLVQLQSPMASQKRSVDWLVLTDRRDDPISALIHPWTYQAQLVDLFPFENNIVTVNGVKHSLLHITDPFYLEHYQSDFGELTGQINKALQHLKASDSNVKANSIKELKALLTALPQAKAEQEALKKHATLVHEITELVNKRHLFEVSELEQDLACTQNKREHEQKVISLLQNPDIDDSDKLRVVLLFALRYEGDEAGMNSVLAALPSSMGQNQLHPKEIVALLLKFAGEKQRNWDIHQNRDFWSVTKSKMTRGLKGVENVYTQYSSLVGSLMNQWLHQGLHNQEDLEILLINDRYTHSFGTSERDVKRPEWMHKHLGPEEFRQSNIMIYAAGGITHFEVNDVQKVTANDGLVGNLLIGGSKMLSATEFVADLLYHGDKTPLMPKRPTEVHPAMDQAMDDGWQDDILGVKRIREKSSHGLFSQNIN